MKKRIFLAIPFLLVIGLIMLFQNFEKPREPQERLVIPVHFSSGPPQLVCGPYSVETTILNLQGRNSFQKIEGTLNLPNSNENHFTAMVLPFEVGHCEKPAQGNQIKICSDNTPFYLRVHLQDEAGKSVDVQVPKLTSCELIPNAVTVNFPSN